MMPSNQLIYVLAAAGGVAYLVKHEGGIGVAAPGAPGPTEVKVNSPSYRAGKFQMQLRPSIINSVLASNAATSLATAQQRDTDAAMRAVEAKMREEYARLSDEAKREGADAANRVLKLDPPLDGTESYDEMAQVIGGAAGAALGASVAGPLGAKVGAIAGAYMADKLEGWIGDEWSDFTSWADKQWSKATDSIGDAWDEVTSWF